jgi:hypothetical protein
MSEIPEILTAVEGLAPEAVAQIEAYVKAREAELKAALEAHYGVKPSVVSDIPVPDAAPALNPAQQSYQNRVAFAQARAAQAAQPQDVVPLPARDATPTSPAIPAGTTSDPAITALLQRMQSLEQQLAEEKAKRENPETITSGSGEPVPHNLFLDDGTVIKNHGGLATSYTDVVPATATSDAQDRVRKVVAAYPA